MPIELRAWSTKDVRLTPEQALAVDASGLASVGLAGAGNTSPPIAGSQVGDAYPLTAGSRVGVVLLPDGETLRVAPKLAIPQLMFLLSYAADPRGWKDIGPQYAGGDLFAAVASAFVAHAERATRPAPLRGYVQVDEAVLTLRGRIRVGDQLARHAGLPLPLEVTHDEFTTDVPENRLLLGAAELLVRLPLVPTPVRRRLLRLRATLDGVAPTRPGPDVRAPLPSRINAHYGGAMALAELLLRRTAITTTAGDTAGVAFSFDLNKVFEDFLTTSLRAAVRRHGGRLEVQVPIHLDVAGHIRMKPDLVWWKDGRHRAVLDAKYKALVDARFPNADAYQLLAYCTAMNLPEGYLVYARDGGATTRTHTVRHAGIEIRVEAIDVEQAPEDVLAAVGRLADRVALGRRP